MSHAHRELPVALENGLTLRWATVEDVDELAAFNVRVHSDNPDEPEEQIAHWTRDLMLGEHPTTDAGDFTVVVDPSEGNKIVSSVVLIAQTWTYDGIELGCGRTELVGTDPAYRRRGLVRDQMEAVHAKSRESGHQIQAITGIPWFYRQFGYEMAVNLGGGRLFFWSRAGNDSRVEEERYRLRIATVEDIAFLSGIYDAQCAGSLMARVRKEAEWRYELTRSRTEQERPSGFFIIETATGEQVAFVNSSRWRRRFNIRELGVKPGYSWRDVCLYLSRVLKKEAESLHDEPDKRVDHLYLNLGVDHPAYAALGTQLEKQLPPYAWYIRVADLGAFLKLISPVLERRLASSAMASHSGKLVLDFYRDAIEVKLEQGKIVSITRAVLESGQNGDASFPDLTFLQLLLGHRTVEELSYARADCIAWNAEARVLLDVLFPKRSSNIVPL